MQLTLDDFERAARERLPHATYEYLASGAADEVTVRWNREAFSRIALRPRALEDVSSIDTRLILLGQALDFPILLAPVAYQRLLHPDGETETARGAGAAGATFVVSTGSTTAIEDIAAAATAPLWMQIYVQKDRGFTRDLLARAEAAGVRAFCLTVDTPVIGTRDRQARAGFVIPADLPTPHLDATGRGRLGIPKREPVTWKDVDAVRAMIARPLLLKGILDAATAETAARAGADGIVVSNHGGRNLDTTPATIDALPEIAARLGGRLPLLLDGGVRRGTDVVKALARGASAVLIGRPYAYGLAAGGADGVARVVRILRDELETAMALLGCASLAALDQSILW